MVAPPPGPPAGNMDRRIVFQRRFEKAAPDANGETQFEWQDISPPVAASIYGDRRRTEITADRRQGVGFWTIRVYWMPTLADLDTAQDRAIDAADADIIFRLDDIRPGDRNDFITLSASTGVAT